MISNLLFGIPFERKVGRGPTERVILDCQDHCAVEIQVALHFCSPAYVTAPASILADHPSRRCPLFYSWRTAFSLNTPGRNYDDVLYPFMVSSSNHERRVALRQAAMWMSSSQMYEPPLFSSAPAECAVPPQVERKRAWRARSGLKMDPAHGSKADALSGGVTPRAA